MTYDPDKPFGKANFLHDSEQRIQIYGVECLPKIQKKKKARFFVPLTLIKLTNEKIDIIINLTTANKAFLGTEKPFLSDRLEFGFKN